MSTLTRPEDIAHAARTHKGEVENASAAASAYAYSSSHAISHSQSSVKTHAAAKDAHIDPVFDEGNLDVSATVAAKNQ